MVERSLFDVLSLLDETASLLTPLLIGHNSAEKSQSAIPVKLTSQNYDCVAYSKGHLRSDIERGLFPGILLEMRITEIPKQTVRKIESDFGIGEIAFLNFRKYPDSPFRISVQFEQDLGLLELSAETDRNNFDDYLPIYKFTISNSPPPKDLQWSTIMLSPKTAEHNYGTRKGIIRPDDRFSQIQRHLGGFFEDKSDDFQVRICYTDSLTYGEIQYFYKIIDENELYHYKTAMCKTDKEPRKVNLKEFLKCCNDIALFSKRIALEVSVDTNH